jgi:DNA mismatch endonuclease (patch repair protein)
MAAVRGKNTTPEKIVRKILHSEGFRFRLHRRDLPGCPDIVLPKHRTCIFVHGCFWHQHSGCRRATVPKTNVKFWRKKFDGNRQRDLAVKNQLTAANWRVIIIWECETKDIKKLAERIHLEFS